MEHYLLDTSALVAFRENEEGAEEVAEILRQAHEGENRTFVSFLTFMEIYYCAHRAYGKGTALQTFLELKTLPLQRVDVRESLLLLAGEIKATCPLSLADSWIAATAIEEQATLVHKDPEFEPLRERLTLRALPYKPSRKKGPTS